MNSSLETSERDARPYTPPPHTPAPLQDPDPILHRIEREVGHDHLHWGQVDPHELIRAVLKHAQGFRSEPSVEMVHLVATGEVYEGQETYTLHDTLPPLCEAETLYIRPQAQAEAGDILQVKQQPFAYFKHEASKGVWSQVMPAAAGQPGVIAAYANPQSLTEPGAST